MTLREAVRNVFDNALSHGARTRLNVCVEGMEGCAKVVVRDDGPGISPDRWEAVKAPFTPRSDGRSGASLGLAIVDEVMRAHDGRLEFSFAADGDFVVSLWVSNG